VPDRRALGILTWLLRLITPKRARLPCNGGAAQAHSERTSPTLFPSGYLV
jgi:hypothetical protein